MGTRSAKVRVERVASRQSGRISWAQLVALDVESWMVSRWVDESYLHPQYPRVYAVGHRAPSVEAQLTAAVLYAGPGAMLSHAISIWWLGLSDRRPGVVEVSTPRRCLSLPGVRVHERRTCRRIWHKNLPVTTVEQSLLDYAATAPFDRLRHALAVADYLKLLDLAALNATLGRGRAGSANLRVALKRHEPKLARTRSPLERLLIPLCEASGIPVPDFNVTVAGVLVDAVWRAERLVVELDGRDNHSSWSQIQEDRRKELRLRAARFDVVRYVWPQLEETPELVAADLLARLARGPG